MNKNEQSILTRISKVSFTENKNLNIEIPYQQVNIRFPFNLFSMSWNLCLVVSVFKKILVFCNYKENGVFEKISLHNFPTMF